MKRILAAFISLAVLTPASAQTITITRSGTQPSRQGLAANFTGSVEVRTFVRCEGVLVVGSGNLVHNLHAYGWGRRVVEPYDWAIRFETRARELMLARHHEPLVEYETLGRDAMLSAPTPDHYLPLLYILGIQQSDETASFPIEGVDGGSISMLTVRVG